MWRGLNLDSLLTRSPSYISPEAEDITHASSPPGGCQTGRAACLHILVQEDVKWVETLVSDHGLIVHTIEECQTPSVDHDQRRWAYCRRRRSLLLSEEKSFEAQSYLTCESPCRPIVVLELASDRAESGQKGNDRSPRASNCFSHLWRAIYTLPTAKLVR